VSLSHLKVRNFFLNVHRLTKLRSKAFLAVAGWGLIGLLLLYPIYAAQGQGATPIPVNPPTATATQPPPTDIPTRTPTSQGPASAEALTDGTNVRSLPDIGGERLGTIAPGTAYPILGRRFEWFQIQFPDSETGSGWVHESVVTVIGDVNQIQDFSAENLPTEDPSISNARGTADAITATPGGFLTLTAQSQITPEGLFTAESGLAGLAAGAGGTQDNAPPPSFGDQGNLPTFTYPAQTPTAIDLQQILGESTTRTAAQGMPPIMPILALFGIGGLGLLISVMRKL
jgi:hypothetical protein